MDSLLYKSEESNAIESNAIVIPYICFSDRMIAIHCSIHMRIDTCHINHDLKQYFTGILTRRKLVVFGPIIM